MQVHNEHVLSHAHVTLTRKEILNKIGFDTNDAFYVTLEDWGRGGVTFTLLESADKYAQKEETSKSPSVTPSNHSTSGLLSRLLGRKHRVDGSPM